MGLTERFSEIDTCTALEEALAEAGAAYGGDASQRTRAGISAQDVQEIARVRRMLEEAARSNRKDLARDALGEAIAVLSPVAVGAGAAPGGAGNGGIQVPLEPRAAEMLRRILAEVQSAANRKSPR